MKRNTAKTPSRSMPEEMEKAIREMPRDAEVINLLKTFPARGRFLCDNRKRRGCAQLRVRAVTMS